MAYVYYKLRAFTYLGWEMRNSLSLGGEIGSHLVQVFFKYKVEQQFLKCNVAG